jgi:hypothetical protein
MNFDWCFNFMRMRLVYLIKLKQRLNLLKVCIINKLISRRSLNYQTILALLYWNEKILNENIPWKNFMQIENKWEKNYCVRSMTSTRYSELLINSIENMEQQQQKQWHLWIHQIHIKAIHISWWNQIHFNNMR